MVVPSDLIVILCTAPEDATARSLAKGLVESNLAACVNAIPGVTSTYRWKGKIETDTEIQLLVKTRRAQFDEVAAWLAKHHPYDVPEIIALNVEAVSQAYGNWLTSEL